MDFFAFAADNAVREFVRDAPIVESVARPQRKDCCADFAYVICCDDETDTWECPFCGITWNAPCR